MAVFCFFDIILFMNTTNIKPFMYVGVLAVIVVGGIGYYLMPEKVAYEPIKSGLDTTQQDTVSNTSGNSNNTPSNNAAVVTTGNAVVNYPVAPQVLPEPVIVDEYRFGFIKKIEQVGTSYQFVMDYAEFQDCSEETNCPSGIKIVNDNPMLRTIPLAPSAVIIMATFSQTNGDFNTDEKITVQQLQNSMSSSTKYNELPFWVTITNGQIVEVKEQFIP